MCGFAGFVGAPDSDLLNRMGDRVRHRGPDQDGAFSDAGCSFIHKRLSIIDLSEAGRQPMATVDGRFVIAYNGEIYNYRELRERYTKEGWTFRTQTDTECFLASVALHGLKDLNQFHGIFAFALWDTKESVCYVARDRMGIKPFYITFDNGRYAFASEIPSLLQLKSKWKIDTIARSLYLTLGYISGPRTIYEGIVSLEPGRLYCIRQGKLDEIGSFTKNIEEKDSLSWTKAKEKLIHIVDKAVSDQLVSDRPVGVFLSGGLDSSVVLSSMRLAQPQGRIKTFTTRFKHDTLDQKFNRDAELAKRTAEKYGCDHHEIEIDEHDVIREAEGIATHLGQPHNNHSTVALDAAARLASKDVTVVLSGDGGDESFGGYERYKKYRTYGPIFGLLNPYFRKKSAERVFRSKSIAASIAKIRGLDKWLSLSGEAGMLLSFHAAHPNLLQSLFGKDVHVEAIRLWTDRLSRIDTLKDPLDRFMKVDRETWLRDDAFVRSDRLTMRHGIELRVPLTDDAVVDFAASLPSRYHVSLFETKKLWRETFADRCLPEVVNEQKRGWFPPTSKWLRSGLKDWSREILEDAIATHSWMNGPALRQAWEDHQASRAYRLQEIWTAIAYHLWWRANRAILSEV
ncbi:MAG: asparagine synthase (glutamine-hydrolyzing) [Patescibacteria group bacterium]|jgi:asparagine synthase (glutamine-hydrolysing)